MGFKSRVAAAAVVTSLVAVPLALSGTAIAQDEKAAGSGSICGVVWLDENADGKRQPGEKPLPGRMITLLGSSGFVGETGADGRYCMEGLAAGEHTLISGQMPNDTLALVKSGGGSKFDWASELSKPIKLAEGERVEGIDAGYITPSADLKAAQLSIRRNGQVTEDTNFPVGAVVEVLGSIEPDGDVPENPIGYITLPAGLRAEVAIGDGAFLYDGRVILPASIVKNEPGVPSVFGARVVVEKAFTDGVIKLETDSYFVDSDPSNDVLTRKINVLPSRPLPMSAPKPAAPAVTPVVTKTAALANTGVDPVAAGAVGLGALVLGGLALFGARRRQKA